MILPYSPALLDKYIDDIATPGLIEYSLSCCYIGYRARRFADKCNKSPRNILLFIKEDKATLAALCDKHLKDYQYIDTNGPTGFLIEHSQVISVIDHIKNYLEVKDIIDS